MARGGLEPPTPRFSVVLPLRLSWADLQDFLFTLGGSHASGLSRTLRPFSLRYGPRWGPWAFFIPASHRGRYSCFVRDGRRRSDRRSHRCPGDGDLDLDHREVVLTGYVTRYPT
jgi:hypothetical protein